MALYWETPPEQTAKSSGKKIAAAIIILMIIISTGVITIFQLIPGGSLIPTNGNVRVAIVDSGLDQDFYTSGRVVAEQSFILPQYGYDTTDTSTADSNPDDGSGNNVRHGTMVTRALVQNSDSAQIVVAKVIDSTGFATAEGLIAAIYWSVEQNCSVINLSLGSSPTYGDPLEAAVEYAWSQGVIIVSAAGNEGDSGLPGTSISSPSVYSKVVSVGALDEDGNPAYYSSQGPTAERYMKPDISTNGFVETSSAIYYGTSFSSPVIAAYVVELIEHCQANEYEYTQGSIIAALLKGATPLDEPEYVVGAGKANLDESKHILDQATREGELPRLTYVDVTSLPLDFETLFQGDNYTFEVEIVTSTLTTMDISSTGIPIGALGLPDSIVVNQTTRVPINIYVPSSSSQIIGSIEFAEDYSSDSIQLRFTPQEPDARIAFDITHTSWSIDTVYGQFKELYIYLTEHDISVTEIRDTDKLTTEYLSNFDAVFLLDPCAWDVNETNYVNPSIFSIPFTQNEIDAYEEYYMNGGGIFVSALSNRTLDIASLNEFLEWTGASLGSNLVPSSGSVVEITNIDAHPITVGVASFDYVGAPLITNTSYTRLARYSGQTVLACLEGSSGGRLVITGTNFFIDNWGMTGNYFSMDDDLLALRISLWLTDLL